MKKLFFVLLVLLGVSYSSMSSKPVAPKSSSPEWVYKDGQYYWDGNDKYVWDYDKGALWE